jgi:hypothetical protein
MTSLQENLVLAASEASCNGGSIPREPAGPPYPGPHCLRLHIRPLGICRSFADRGLSVLVIRSASALDLFLFGKEKPAGRDRRVSRLSGLVGSGELIAQLRCLLPADEFDHHIPRPADIIIRIAIMFAPVGRHNRAEQYC